ncbi:MAG: hypothetical protein JRF40_02170 [Deltaproteobacteria bacterium]|nr:hypothetical protein [Deltaproteobacteria bacterium]
MQIGGINISVECRTADICLPLEPVYQGFAEKSKTTSADASDITVSLEIDDMPDIEGMKKIFESGSSWSMLLDGEDRLISLKPPEFENPVWMARMGKDYRDVTVYCGNELIGKNREKQEIPSPVCYPLDQILVMYFLSERQGALIHAAGVEVKGKGLVFPGKSGAGKSTLCSQISKRPNIKPFSDDRMIVKKEEGRFVAYGTPWPGEAGIAENKSVQLSGLMFLSQGQENRIKKISNRQAMERLMPVTSIPWYDKPVMEDVLGFCGAIATEIPTYELEFRPEVGVVDVIEEFMQE